MTRRHSREDALQILFQFDHTADLSVEKATAQFQEHFKKKTVDDFSLKLVAGVQHNLGEIDKRIEEVSQHWKTHRMESVDRNILRLGVYELCYCTDIPSTVTINEWIEIAKGFGTESSAAFINGILDKVKDTYPLDGKAP